MNCCPVILCSREHLWCGRFKRWQNMTIDCLTSCGSTKPISHFEGLTTPTTAECWIRATENPRTFVQTPQHDASGVKAVNVTGERCASMLQNRIILNLVDKHLLESMTFMQNGVPSHITRQVNDFLHRPFGDDCVLSCHFRYACSSRSPDLNPCDYWLWCYMKSLVRQQ